MIITQDALIRQIADKEAIDATTVRTIFKSAENIIFDCLSSTEPSENIVVKLLNGVHLERKYIENKRYTKGMFQNIDCTEHVNVKASSSRYFSTKVNTVLFSKYH